MRNCRSIFFFSFLLGGYPPNPHFDLKKHTKKPAIPKSEGKKSSIMTNFLKNSKRKKLKKKESKVRLHKLREKKVKKNGSKWIMECCMMIYLHFAMMMLGHDFG